MYTGNNPGLPRFQLLIACSMQKKKQAIKNWSQGKLTFLPTVSDIACTMNMYWTALRLTHELYATYARLIIGKGNVLQILLCAVGFSQQERAKYWHSLHGEFRTLECPSFTLVLALFKKRGNDTFLSTKRGRGTDRLVTVAVFRQSQQTEY